MGEWIASHVTSSRHGISREAMAVVTPLGRIGKPEEIAPGVVFLASSDSAWMTGETPYMIGGLR